MGTKTVADPNTSYEDLSRLWTKCRVICNGERHAKSFDSYLDVTKFSNLLIPFSPSMSPAQYAFYKAEAELPGITAQFSKMVVGGLLRKQPVLTLPDNLPEGALEWITSAFGQDDISLSAFLDQALWEEVQTSRAWVYVDYPSISEELTYEERLQLKPYPVLWSAESVINWQVGQTRLGKQQLTRVILKGAVAAFVESEFHPEYVNTVWVHELDETGFYQIRTYQEDGELYKLVDVNQNILANGNRLSFIPAWPLNGSIEPSEPIFTAIVDKEVALYNKVSRRNHLLYGASTYTPYIASDISDEEFEEMVSGGLGTWLRLRQGDTAGVLDTPTDALQDMDRAIAAAIEEMAKLGIRMLTPETAQSGIALEIRNAAQTAQLGTLNTKVSNTMAQVISTMLNWRYDLGLAPTDVQFSLSADFNPIPLGADWLRLATEWYQQGLIPRSVWLNILKTNDIVAPDYDDEEGKAEINGDELLLPRGDSNTLVE